jgi:predicted TIM-barrel fold metal-dependent hydrolase
MNARDDDSADTFEVIDADGHVQEPADLWERYIDKRYYAFRPLVDQASTDNLMLVAGRALPTIMTRHPASEDYRDVMLGGWNRAFAEEFAKGVDGFSATWFLDAMDHEGIDRMVLYPSRGLYACAVDGMDAGLANAISDAYNRWLGDFCSADPARLVPVALASLHDPASAAKHLEKWVRELACPAVMLRPNPVNGRNLNHTANDVFWAAAEDLGVVIASHEGTGACLPEFGPDRFSSRLAQHAISHVFEQMQAVYCFTAGGILERFPTLRAVFLESGGTWLPPWLHRLDEHAEQLADVASETGGISKAPSAYFRDQCWIGCEPDEPNVAGLLDYVGADRVVWASDFPHPDGKYPGLVNAFVDALSAQGVAPADIVGFGGANARTLYRLPAS